jgi:hypothetical protein
VQLFSRFAGRALAVIAFLALTTAAAATKPQTLITAAWREAPASARLGQNVALLLRIESAADSPNVIVLILPTDGITIVDGNARWSGSLAKGQVLELPYTVRVVADGDWTLGASVTNKRADTDQVSGAVLRVRARDGVATLRTDAPPSRR